MNLDLINNSSLYIGKTVSVNLDDWTITFLCPALSPDAEFIAAPLFNHTHEILEGDQLLIIKPNDNFSDNLFYHPITLRKFIGLKFDSNIIDITDGKNIIINANSSITITTTNMNITATTDHTGDVSITGNLKVSGNIDAGGNISAGSNVSAGADVSSSAVGSLNAHMHGNGNMGSPTTPPLG